jgi:UDP-N-acetylglucosamine 2-epimerase (non-hydrolysing)
MLELKILHTGQHSDAAMSDVFFSEFNLEIDHKVELQPASAVSQIGEMLIGIEGYVNKYKPDIMIVPGDVNSTLAGALVAHKMGIYLAHLEAGLRSFDRQMPEEINRIITDEISNLFFITEQSGLDNLKNEGKNTDSMHLVGNTMIDTLVAYDSVIRKNDVLIRMQINKPYALATIHRPSNVDTKPGLMAIIEKLNLVAEKIPVVFPVHPRTTARIREFGLENLLIDNNRIRLTQPLAYFDFQNLILNASLVITDSGGVQEETTFRKIPCITLRHNTERPVTCSIGTNRLIGENTNLLIKAIEEITSGLYPKGEIPTNWDGNSTERIIKIIENV